MPPRPFPFPISVGTDICSIPRIQKVLVKDHNSGFKLCRKILSDKEFALHWGERIGRAVGGRRRKIGELVGEEARVKKRLKEDFKIKKEQLGIDPRKFTEMMGRQSTSIKEGTDEEPMRPTDSHILKMINTFISAQTVKTSVDRLSKVRLEYDAAFVAGRWAAKEAIIKAYHSRRLTFHDIAILPSNPVSPNEGSRPPVAVVASESGNWNEGQIVPLSISHDGDYAIATCMAYEPSPGAVFETADDVNKALGGTNDYKGSRPIQLESEGDDVDGTLDGTKTFGVSRSVDLELEVDQPLADAPRPIDKEPSRLVSSSVSYPTFRRVYPVGEQLEERKEDPSHHTLKRIPLASRKLEKLEGTQDNNAGTTPRQTGPKVYDGSADDSVEALLESPDDGNLGGRTDHGFEPGPNVQTETGPAIMTSKSRALRLMADGNQRRITNLINFRGKITTRARKVKTMLSLMPFSTGKKILTTINKKTGHWGSSLSSDLDAVLRVANTRPINPEPDDFGHLQKIGQKLSLFEEILAKVLDSYKVLASILLKEVVLSARLGLPDIPPAELEKLIIHEELIRENLPKDISLAAELWQLNPTNIHVVLFFDVPPEYDGYDLSRPWDSRGRRFQTNGVIGRLYKRSSPGTSLTTGAAIFKSAKELSVYWGSLARFPKLRSLRRTRRTVDEPLSVEERAAVTWTSHHRQRSHNTDGRRGAINTFAGVEPISESVEVQPDSESTSATETLSKDETKDTAENSSLHSLRSEYEKYMGRIRKLFGSK